MKTEEINAIAERVAEILATKGDARYCRSVTRSEAAKKMGVDRSTIYRWLRVGRLAAGGRGVLLSSIEQFSKE